MYFEITFSGVKKLSFCHYVRTVIMDIITRYKICKSLVVYRF